MPEMPANPEGRLVRIQHLIQQRYKVSRFHSPIVLDEFTPVCLNRFRATRLLEDGSFSRQIGNPTGPPYPTHHIHPQAASSADDFSSSSVDIPGVRQFSNMWIAPMAWSSEGPMIPHVAPPNEQLVLGDLDTSHS